MQHYIDLANYGNRDISGGIDRFWLQGGLRITSLAPSSYIEDLLYRSLSAADSTLHITAILDRGSMLACKENSTSW